MKLDRKCRQRLLSLSSGINVFIVLPVVLQILTAQGTAAPSIGSSPNTTEEKRTVVKPPPTVSLARPVEITSRPEPIYTDEARASKTEGTVILQVTSTTMAESLSSTLFRNFPTVLLMQP